MDVEVALVEGVRIFSSAPVGDGVRSLNAGVSAICGRANAVVIVLNALNTEGGQLLRIR
jgi:hypothetical protein